MKYLEVKTINDTHLSVILHQDEQLSDRSEVRIIAGSGENFPLEERKFESNSFEKTLVANFTYKIEAIFKNETEGNVIRVGLCELRLLVQHNERPYKGMMIILPAAVNVSFPETQYYGTGLYQGQVNPIRPKKGEGGSFCPTFERKSITNCLWMGI